nr:Fe-S cluster assembly protein SufD [candidate division Zixibacteria bacterium]
MATKTTAFRKASDKESKWLYNKRKNDWAAYLESNLPDRVVHLWKYTDPAQFLLDNQHKISTNHSVQSNLSGLDKDLLKAEFAGYGYNRPDLMTIAMLNPELNETGIIFKDLNTAVFENENLVGNHLGHLIGSDFGKFEAMNSALWNSGLFLYIPDNTIIEKPIQLHRHPVGAATFLRLLVIVGKNAEVTLIDDYHGQITEGEGLLNSAVEIFAGAASRVRYANLQRLPHNCRAYITYRSRVDHGANIFSALGALGGSVSKVNTGTVLNGRGSESRIAGIVFGGKDQHFDYHTLHEHRADESFSNIDFRVILKDKAVSAYTGLIKIDEQARNCEAYQINRNLLLNPGTKAESIPELEILNDQVRCTHGATMGPIDPEMLFYLRSRGISNQEAVKTVVSGFVEPMINELPESLRETLRNMVVGKLTGEDND